MDNQEIDEDSIDLEALQAQIDMSMSFAQEIVSSWLKPSRKLPSRSSRHIEAELKEYMHRPPRLGVGAAIPETHKSSRETARLKGQLIGNRNQGSREDEPGTKENSGDEEESRAGAIKKKARVDPFGTDGGKGKKSNLFPGGSALVPPKPPALPETEREEQEEVISMVTEDIAGPSTPTVMPQRKKRKKKHLAVEPSTDVAVALESSSTPVWPQNTKAQDSSSNFVKRHAAGLLNTPVRAQPIDVSFTSTPATPLQMRRQEQSATLLKQPLLNLAPHSSDDEFEDETKIDASGDSPKKKRKRKRRKKKKSAANGSAAEVLTKDVADVA